MASVRPLLVYLEALQAYPFEGDRWPLHGGKKFDSKYQQVRLLIPKLLANLRANPCSFSREKKTMLNSADFHA